MSTEETSVKQLKISQIELTGPIATRGNAALNLIATNIHRDIRNLEALDPIMSEDGKKSDHKCLAFSTTLENSDRFRWVHVMAQKKTPESKGTRFLIGGLEKKNGMTSMKEAIPKK